MKKLMLTFLLLATGFACQPSNEETSKGSSVVFQGGDRWPNPKEIPVCIVNRPVLSDEMFNDLKDYTVNDFRRAGVNLVGWGDCSAQDFNLKIIRVYFNQLHDWSNPNSLSAGGGLSWIGPASNDCTDQCDRGTMRIDIGNLDNYPMGGLRDFAIFHTRATVVHEFGHALGLGHEHERSDSPRCGDNEGTIGNVAPWAFVGNYDPNSIMNYCKNDGISTLSVGDIAGLKYLYPVLNSDNLGDNDSVQVGQTVDEFVLISRNSNRCVDVPFSSLDNGTKLQQYDCNQSGAQIFRLRKELAGSYTLQNANSGKCIEVPSSSLDNGAPVTQWDCNGTDSQRVYLTKTSDNYFTVHFAHSNRCMDVESSRTDNGAAIIQWDCHGGANQQFRLERIFQ